MLYRLVQDVIGSGDVDALHSVCAPLLAMFDENGQEALPTSLLPLLYETNPCTCCRADLLEQMKKYNVLTRQILQECLEDASDEVRTFAAETLEEA